LEENEPGSLLTSITEYIIYYILVTRAFNPSVVVVKTIMKLHKGILKEIGRQCICLKLFDSKIYFYIFDNTLESVEVLSPDSVLTNFLHYYFF
jgi:hypothetical protein